MKTSVRIFISALMLLCSISLYAEHRIFPANSIHCVNVVTKTICEWNPMQGGNQQKNTYYHYYTGNDTIVDGKTCVMLWQYCEDTPKEKELRFLCEENGLISYKYPLAEGGYSDWRILFEFPIGGWKEGEKYVEGYFMGEPHSTTPDLSPYTLLNGEETQMSYDMLIYGIGYIDWPFFEYRDFSEGRNNTMQPYSFYRNDTLLWGKPATHGPFFPANSIRCTNMVTSLFNSDTIYYNIYTGGDTIVDGKECVQLWQYCTDTPDSLEQYLLHEVDDKVYIKYSAYGNDEWQLLYDFSLPVWYVGDSIEAAANTHLIIESIDTITLLNGKIRQVANKGLIHGIGNAHEPYFNLLYCISEGEQCQPVSFYYWNELLWGKELPKKREELFFPANEVYTTNEIINFSYNLEEQRKEYDTIRYNVWTGNDTIIDGRKCVAVWNNIKDSIKLHGIIYESLNGVVYFNWRVYTREYWLTLYDFTPRKWKAGDKICLCSNGISDEYEKIKDISSVTLHNGESVPRIGLNSMAGDLIYGIGYQETPFLTPETYGGPINFYRNGVLLWGEEENMENSVATPMVNKVPSLHYDLPGRPVAHPTRGIYIKDGKKVVIK